MKNKLEFNLTENAEDSLEYAIELLSYEHEIKKETKYKRAILAIFHGIELLLKERLRRIHPSLIWENIDKYPDLNGRTVGLDKAMHRLKKIGGLILLEKDEQLLRSLKKTRNAIEHYTWSIPQREAEYIIGFSLSFALFFAEHHLELDIIGYKAKRDGSFTDLLLNSQNFEKAYNRRSQVSFSKISGKKEICNFCKALITKEDKGECKKCGYLNENWNEFSELFDVDMPF